MVLKAAGWSMAWEAGARTGSLPEQLVDIFVGDFAREVRAEAAAGTASLLQLNLFDQFLEDLGHFVGGLAHAQPHQANRRPRVEQNHQDGPSRDDRDVNVLLGALMELTAELLFPEQLGDFPGGRDVS